MSNTFDWRTAEWRISQSGYSIKAGWGDDKVILAACPGASQATHAAPGVFERWMEWAGSVCDHHNISIVISPPAPQGGQGRCPVCNGDTHQPDMQLLPCRYCHAEPCESWCPNMAIRDAQRRASLPDTPQEPRQYVSLMGGEMWIESRAASSPAAVQGEDDELVRRLREVNGPLADEAANEITLLREQLQTEQRLRREQMDEIIALRHDIERHEAVANEYARDAGGIRRFTAYRRNISQRETHSALHKNADHEPQFAGVVWPDGTVTLRWLTPIGAHSVWASLRDALEIHGHPEYGTEIIWHDDAEPPREWVDMLDRAAMRASTEKGE